MKKRTNGKKVKYIFVTGGVLSSLGKGIAASSIGSLLECSGLKITILKLDPYQCRSGDDESLSAWRGLCDR